jgi:hypothetical protein
VFVHAVLEGFAAVDENDGNFVGELAAQLLVGVHVDFLPGEAAPAMELNQGFLHDLAKMAALAGVDHDLAGPRHGASLAEIYGGMTMISKPGGGRKRAAAEVKKRAGFASGILARNR